MKYTISLKTALILSLAFVVIIASSIQGVFVYRSTSEELVRNVESLTDNMVEQYAQSIGQYLKGIERVALNVKTSTVTERTMAVGGDSSFYAQVEANQEAVTFFREVAFTNNNIAGIVVYTDNRSSYNYGIPFGYYALSSIRDPLLLLGLEQDVPSGYIPTHNSTIVKDSYYKNTFLYFDKIYRGSQVQAVVCVVVGEQALEGIIRQSRRSGEEIFIQCGERIVSPYGDEEIAALLLQEDYQDPDVRTVSYKGGQYLRSSAPMDNGWQVVSLVPMEQINQSSRTVSQRLFFSLLISFLVYLVLLVLISNAVSQRLNRLNRRLSSLGTPEEKPFIEDNFFITEIVRLNNQFNRMNQRIDMLKDQVKEEQMLIDKVSMDLLQAQINPHFLYNTLDSINWMAMGMGADNISEMCSNLAQMFRCALNSGQDVTLLENELEHLHCYIEIQKYRYNNRFLYEEQVDERLLGSVTLNIILQPFVENSLIHGLRDTDERIHIRLLLEEDGEGRIRVLVEDDGAGCDESFMNDYLTSRSHTAKGYGIWNVNQRIQLRYGPEYGVTYLKCPVGTTVQILLPLLPDTPPQLGE